MRASDQIQSSAPPGAHLCRLSMQRSDESTVIYPMGSPPFFRIGEAPFGVPPGTYVIRYFDMHGVAIRHPEKYVTISPEAQGISSMQEPLPLGESPHPVLYQNPSPDG